jgi:hypothetical protein
MSITSFLDGVARLTHSASIKIHLKSPPLAIFLHPCGDRDRVIVERFTVFVDFNKIRDTGKVLPGLTKVNFMIGTANIKALDFSTI